MAYAIVHRDGTADLFVASEKVGPEVRQHLGNGVRLHERHAFEAALAEFKGKTVVVDPERAVAAIFEALEKAGATILPLRDPTILPKAVKNPVEVAGQKAAQARDGAVISRFLKWIDDEAPKGTVDELMASDHLEALRREHAELRDLSFDSISGAGPNGAIVHYKSAKETNRKLETGTLYLIDSGGQYVDGTTDITRTVPIGEPTEEMRDRFTRVLKGHIAIATAVFPQGHPRAASSTALPAGRCGKRGSITPTAPATGSAASSRSTKGRSGSRRREVRRPAATSRCCRA